MTPTASNAAGARLGGACELFVRQLELLAPQIGLDVELAGLFLSPLATELPELINTVVWIRRGKTAMAMANVSGAMVVQCAFPGAIGLAFTRWQLSDPVLLAAGLTGAATVVAMRSRYGKARR